MKEAFIERNFSVGSRALIMQANAIIAEYQEAGFTLTLRQLYYQFVARDIIANKQTEYKRLGSVINDARLAGMIDWEAIEDRTRFLRDFTTYRNPSKALDMLARTYLEPLWRDQDAHLEVWIEKDALIGVIEPACSRWRLPYFACRGNVSQSELYAAGKRLRSIALNEGKRVIVLHLGDHDPSGVDMTRDNRDRVDQFSKYAGVEVRRIALNMDQIEQYNPPPNPAKESDSRWQRYVDEYGTTSSWELDALSPQVIDQLIEAEVQAEIDMELWDIASATELDNRNRLKEVSARWGDIEAFLKGNDDDQAG